MNFTTFNKPARDHLNEVYDHRGGIIYHKKRRSGVTVGAVAGSLSGNGYLYAKVNGRKVMVSRIIYAMVNDCAIKNEIDHIDGNTLNNHPSNLRDVTHEENMNNLACHR